MVDTVRKVARLTMMLNEHQRITVRKIQCEFDLSRSATYRWLKSISQELPIKIHDGVVRVEKRQK